MARHVPRSLAGQAAALMLGIVAVIVVLGGALAALDARRDGDDAARERVVASRHCAGRGALDRCGARVRPADRDPAAGHRAGPARNTEIAFITIMSPDGTRYTHTDPSLIGQKYLGTTEPALRGETFTEVFTGTLGPSIRAVAPVYASDGRDRRAGLRGDHAADAGRALAASGRRSPLSPCDHGGRRRVGMWLVRRRLLRQTGGLPPASCG